MFFSFNVFVDSTSHLKKTSLQLCVLFVWNYCTMYELPPVSTNYFIAVHFCQLMRDVLKFVFEFQELNMYLCEEV